MRPLALALCLVPAAAVADDDGLRCGSWLVSVGARKPEVADKCGPPTAAATHQRCWSSKFGVACVAVELWTYDRGPTEFVRTLEFDYDVLEHVFVGSHGTR